MIFMLKSFFFMDIHEYSYIFKTDMYIHEYSYIYQLHQRSGRDGPEAGRDLRDELRNVVSCEGDQVETCRRSWEEAR